MIYGYARVSTLEQNTAMQMEAFARAGVVNVVEEKKSAVSVRPALEALLKKVQEGDVIVVYKMDRLARSLLHFLSMLAQFEAKGVAFRSLTEPIDTSTPVGRLFLHMIGSFAEFERALIRERCAVGRQLAIARGQKWGRPRVLNPDQEAQVVDWYRAGGVTIDQIAARLGVKRGAVRAPLGRAGLISSRYLQ